MYLNFYGSVVVAAKEFCGHHRKEVQNERYRDQTN